MRFFISFMSLYLLTVLVENFKAVTVLMSQEMTGNNISMFQNDIYVFLVELRVKPLLSGSSLKGSWWHVTYDEDLRNKSDS